MSCNPFGRRSGRRTNRLTRKARRAQRNLSIENLEQRQLLAADLLYRVNAGGGEIAGDPAWVEDSAFTNAGAASSKTFSVSSGIDTSHVSVPVGTPEAMFKSERWDSTSGQEMQWDFAVSPGTYEVRLYFAEVYSGAQGVGKRVFDVAIEGGTVLEDYDIYADVGGNTGVMKSFIVSSDSNLDIDFSREVQNPAIKGIEILLTDIGNRLASSTTALSFSGTLIGNTVQQTVTLTNVGESGDPDITIDPAQLNLSGANASVFDVDLPGSSSIVLQPGDQTTLTVSFEATDASTKTALISLPHSGENSPLTINLSGAGVSEVPISFGKSSLEGEDASRPTSLQFGPDGRLYVAQQDGLLKIYTIERVAANDYQVIATETLTDIQDIQNHNDDGSPNNSVDQRLVTGLYVAGSATNPVIYVTSSDPRIGAGGSGADLNLDTNSGMLSRLTWNGTSWEKLDLVRGLPRSEENHAPNGIAIDHTTNTLYIAQGGLTNMGAPSNNFAYLPEFALSAAILSVDLDAIGDTTYDIPTLDDEDKPGADASDPFGGNDGKNQAIIVPGGPVQVYAPGFRNPYDVIITESGRMYSVDNGPNAGWGGEPDGEGPEGNATNEGKNGGATHGDGLHYISGEGYYGGHPNPTRSNTDNTFNDSNPQSPVSVGNPIESDYRKPGDEDGALHVWGNSTNGLTEYTASNFQGSLKGDLLTASFDNAIKRVKLNAAGDTAVLEENLFGQAASVPLDVTAVGDDGLFPGTVWVTAIGDGSIKVFEPADYGNTGGGIDPQDEDDLDGDGYLNDDEIANGTNPNNAADFPADWDGDFVSNLLDTDDDNDGLLDNEDPFAVDATNGLSTAVGVSHTWENEGDDIGGLINAGFTGLMTNGVDNYEALFDPLALTSGGAAGVLTLDGIGEGDATGSLNTQQQAFQLGVNVAGSQTPVTAHTAILAAFGDETPEAGQSMGLFIGSGDQDNYLKIVVSATGIETQLEVNGVASSGASANLSLPGPAKIDLYLTVDVTNSTVQAAYDVDGAGKTLLGSPVSVPASWLNNPTQGMAAGIISTSAGPASAIPATWDLIEVVAEAAANLPPVLLPITDISMVAGTSQQVTITASDPNSDNVALTIPDLPSYASFVDGGNGSGVLTLNPQIGDVGAGDFTVVATDNGSPVLTDDQVVNIAINPPAPPAPGGEVVYRVNAGGGNVSGDPAWTDDDGFTNDGPASSKTYSTSATISMQHESIPEGTPQTLFKTERYDESGGQEMQWDFAVDAGMYEVRLYFAETYGSTSGVGKRVFDVAIEGETVLDNYDIFADAGKNTAVMKSFVVQADTNIDIDFDRVVQNPLVRAIEIVTAGSSPGVLASSTSALDFGSVATGESASQFITLTNSGGEGDPIININTANIAITGSGAAAYSVVTTGTLSVPPGGSANLEVQFAPTISGNANANLSLVHTGTNTPLVVSLAGVGAGPAADTASVFIEVDSGGSLSSSSTYSNGSFKINNNSTNGERIASIRFDIDSAFLPDVVFDPFGTAGDPVGKDFTPNSGGSATGEDGHTYDKPLHTGFQALEVAFDDFDPGEFFSFSVDIDPTTIRGANDPGPSASGSISGMELSGSKVTITFEDGSILTSELFREAGSNTGSIANIEANAPAAPSLQILGLPTPDITADANQVVRVSGAPGATVRLLHTEAALHLSGVPGGGYDVDAFESNKVIDLNEQTIVIGSGGFTDVPLTLLRSDDEGGLNHILAVATSGDQASEVAHLLVEYDPATADNLPPVLATVANPTVTAGDTQVITLTATDPNGDNVTFSATGLPSYATLVNNGANTATLTLAPTESHIGTDNIVITATDNGSPVLTDSQSVTITVEEEVIVDPTLNEVIYRVNTGGGSIAGDPTWTTDSGFVNSGSKTYSTNTNINISHASIPEGTPASLFKSERYDPAGGAEMEFDFQVDAGQSYEVRLYFAEIYSGAFKTGGRVFDVAIDGNIVLDNYDIFADVGKNAGVMKSFVIEGDGNLDIDLLHVTQNPAIKGIEILAIGSEGSAFFLN